MGDPISITYEELLSFNPNDLEEKSSSSSAAANASSTTRVLLDKIGLAYGPQGWGILFVSGVPGCETARRALLPLAAQFARLPEREQEACVHAESLYSVGWSHGKEALARGTVDTAKGSFYAKPLLLWESDDAHQQQQQRQNALAQKHPECFAPNLWPTRALPALQPAFVTMGLLLHRVGCLLATVCDAYCLVRHGVATSIAPTLQPSLNATGRLLHYFAMNEQRQQPEDHHHHPDDETSPSSLSPLEPQAWCGWHNDHSALTGLVAGMYLNDKLQPVAPPPETRSGLYIQPRGKDAEPALVCIPPNHCAFQIGETSQILSGGILQATPHAVLSSSFSHTGGMPIAPTTTTRESFALFLAPEFDDILNVPNGCNVSDCYRQSDNVGLGLRPLKDRWRQGQKFGDFHLATVSSFTTK